MPYDIVSKIRSAENNEIKIYSEMNEDDPEDVDKSINEIINSCSFLSDSNRKLSYKDLTQADKLYFFFAIRDYTFRENNKENKLVHKGVHPETGEKNEIEINKDSFDYYKISSGIMKHYDELERCFIIKNDKFNEPMKIYVPTIGVINYFVNYIRSMERRIQSGDNIYYDKKKTVLAQFLIDDWRKLDPNHSYLNSIVEKISNYNSDEMIAINYLSKNLNLNIKPTITIKFKKGGDLAVPVKFRKYSTLFDIQNIIGELFEDTK
jgi:hypothetical protein